MESNLNRPTPQLHLEDFTEVQFPMLANAIISLAKHKVQFAVYWDERAGVYFLSHPVRPVVDTMLQSPPPLSVA